MDLVNVVIPSGCFEQLDIMHSLAYQADSTSVSLPEGRTRKREAVKQYSQRTESTAQGTFEITDVRMFTDFAVRFVKSVDVKVPEGLETGTEVAKSVKVWKPLKTYSN